MIGAVCVLLLTQISLVQNAPLLTKEDLIRNDVSEQDTYLTPEDFETSQRLQEVDLHQAGIDTEIDPILKAKKFEGDIAGFDSSSIRTFIQSSNSFARNAVKDTWRLWPNGEVPYVISSQYGSYSKGIIAKAMDEYHKKTCIRFVPRDENKHKDYIYIHSDEGCYSLVGKIGGRQPVSLDSSCMKVGTVQHELMHASGFFHEQSRSDRDDYIDIIQSNVQPDALDQFEKYSLNTISLLDLPYDYGSLLHYGPYAFSKNGQKVIIAKKSGGDGMGQRDGFSTLDLEKLNKLYKCSKTATGTLPTPSASSQSGDTVSPTPSDTMNVVPKKCENQKWRCSLWHVLGYCTSDPNYMKQYCTKSCNMCNNPEKSMDSTSNDTSTQPPPKNNGNSWKNSNGLFLICFILIQFYKQA